MNDDVDIVVDDLLSQLKGAKKLHQKEIRKARI
jgi:hypothetical protein